jgi:hypothetical protein
MAGSFRVRLFRRDDRRRSMPGETCEGERCRPALMVAAAWREDNEGERGEGGLGRAASAGVMEILRGRIGLVVGGGDAVEDKELRSGGMVVVEEMGMEENE